MADNSAALRRARRQDSRDKRRRAAEAITAMDQSGEPVTFPAVARRAGVSVSLLYADAELSSRIATARDRQRQAGTERAWRLPARSLVTEQSLRTELANARERARRLAEEVTLLRERLSRQLGAAADAIRDETLSPVRDELERRATDLEAENHQQHLRTAQLQAEVRELTETLEAARAMNRELMGELNRTAPTVRTEARSSRRPG